MKRILMLICILTLALPITLYAQTGEEMGLVTQQLRDFNQYYIGNPQAQKPTILTSDFLKTINTDGQAYADSPAEKGGVGAINMATAWTDIPREINNTSEEYNILAGATLGLGRGLVSGLMRGVSGAYDVATFGLPPYDEPAMKPEYKVDHPQQKGLKLTVFSW